MATPSHSLGMMIIRIPYIYIALYKLLDALKKLSHFILAAQLCKKGLISNFIDRELKPREVKQYAQRSPF